MANLTAKTLHSKLKQNKIYRDYFNKYCCLPVFGQRITYMQQSNEFSYDPQPIIRKNMDFRLSCDMVENWIITERLTLFKRSLLASELNLCIALCNMWYTEPKRLEPPRNPRDLALQECNRNLDQIGCYELLDELKQKCLCKVHHMKSFTAFVESTRPDNKLISFWIEADRLKSCDKETKKILLRKLQMKYYTTSSPCCLPYHLLDEVYIGEKSKGFSGYGLQYTYEMQNHLIKKLHSYWLPRFLLSRQSVGKSEKNLLRKLKTIQSEKEEIEEKSVKASKLTQDIADQKIRINESKKNEKAETTGSDEDKKKKVTFPDIGLAQSTKLLKSEETSSQKSTSSFHRANRRPSNEEELLFKQLSVPDSIDSLEEEGLTHEADIKGQWRKYPVSKMEFFLQDFITPPASDSSDSDHETSDYAIRYQHYWSQGFVNPNLGSYESNCVSGQALTKFKKIKKIKRRLGPVHSDIMPQVQLKKQREKREVAVRKCSSEIRRADFSLPEIPKFYSNIEHKSQYYQPKFDSNVQVHKSSPVVLETKPSEEYPADSMIGDLLDDGLDVGDIRSTVSFPKPKIVSKAIPSKTYFQAPKKNISHVKALYKVIYENTEEYLQHVESRLSLADVLTCDPIAAFPFRAFLSNLSELGSISSNKITAGGDHFHKVKFTEAYDIWQEAEEIRTTFFSLNTLELKKRIAGFLQKYVTKPNSPFYNLRELKLKNDRPYPLDLVYLQQEIEKLLGIQWMKYAVIEQEKFRDFVISDDKKTYKRRNSFPSSIPEMMHDPILRTPLLLRHPDDKLNFREFESQVKCGKLESLNPTTYGEMKYRVSRSFFLLVRQENRSSTSTETGFMRFVGEESSDDEGGLPLSRPKIYIRLPDPPKTYPRIYERSCPIVDYKLQSLGLKTRMKQTVESVPTYMRPVKRQGVIVHRPKDRPDSLEEMLTDSLHYEFFKKYLKMHNSEAPLLFWKAVEILKRLDRSELRQRKAIKILQTFFSKAAGRGMVLQCDANIIKEIAVAETVTTSMLVEAAKEVLKSMEKNWAVRYFKTFTDPDSDEEDEHIEDVKQLKFSIIKTVKPRLFLFSAIQGALEIIKSKTWVFFCDFIRSVSCFLKSMRNPKQFESFRKYLKDIPKTMKKKKLNKGASSTALLFEQYETVYFKHNREELQIKYLKKKFQGRELILNFLANDFMFFCETERFLEFCSNVRELKRAKIFDKDDMNVVKEKRETILKCFVDSNIPPSLRVNIPVVQANDILAMGRRNAINRTMFFRARMTVFPVIMFFWKRYSYSRLSYQSKKETKMKHADEVEKRRKLLTKAKNKKFLEKALGPQAVGAETYLPGTPSDDGKKYICDDADDEEVVVDKDGMRMKKIKGLVHTDPPRVHFSLENGLKLIVPPKAKVVERIRAFEDDDLNTTELVDVWTRNARIVKVIAKGSNPILSHLRRPEKDFIVKCDMLEAEI